MEIELEQIKTKFRYKAQVDIKDLDLALRAAPALIREVERLERALADAEKKLTHLSSQLKYQPPLKRTGEKDGGCWETRADDKNNRLFIKLSGRFNYRNAKTASNHVLAVLPHLREGFDVVNDISGMDPAYEKKAAFHLRKVTYHLARHGVVRIVTVINPQAPDLASLFNVTLPQFTYQNLSVKTAAEAVTLLDNVRFLKI